MGKTLKKNWIRKAWIFFAINLCEKKEYINESLPIISKDTSVKAAITSSVSQRGKKQGPACLPSDHFTSPVTVITWYKQEQEMCAVIRLPGVSIILIKMEQGNKWIERKEEKWRKREKRYI